MDPRTLTDFCLLKLDEITDRIAVLDDETANDRPDLPGANSPYAILAHCLGMMRRWSSTVNLDVPVPRDRDAEFAASGTVEELLAQTAQARAALVADFAATDFGSAPRGFVKDHYPTWRHSAFGVVLHIFEELCQHLGHLEITLDLLGAERRD